MVWFRFRKGEAGEGDPFPYVELRNTDGTVYDTGKLEPRWHVFYFYPKDNTPGCSAQARTYSEMIPEFEKEGIEVAGVNTDSVDSHRNFCQKKGLNIRLLTDEEGKLAQKLGVRIFFGACSRDTVIVDPKGKIARILRGVNPKQDPEKVLEWIRTMR